MTWQVQLHRKKIKTTVKTILYLVSFIFRLLDFLWPKRSNEIVFGSHQGSAMAGSPKYLYEYVKEQKSDLEGFYYLPFKENGTLSQILYIARFTRIFFRAKFLVSSHPPFDFVPFSWSKRKILINAWHGTPLKCMFFTDPGATHADLKEALRVADLTSIFLVSSSMEAGLISRCFFLDSRKIVCTGHPRNDRLVEPSRANLMSTLLPNAPDYSTLILYCPTYRRNASIRFFPFDDFDPTHLDAFLERHDIVILTRGHVQDNKTENGYESTRIIELGQDLLSEVNDILPETDVLITDYSSIFFDYLLCDNPCLFIPYDVDNYRAEVGLLFDDYDYWTPGRKIGSYKEFIEALEDLLAGNDHFKEKRAELKQIFHYYQTGNSSERLTRYIEQNW